MDNLKMSDLYNLRMIVLLEDGPQSNKYFQIALNEKQYKKLTEVVQKMFPNEKGHDCGDPDCVGALIETTNEKITLPENIREINV